MLALVETFNLITHNGSLFFVRIAYIKHNLVALLVLAKHILLYLSAVVLYQTVGSIHNILCASIVLFKFKQLRVAIYILEVQYIVDIGTSKGIYALGVIAYNTYIGMVLRKKCYYALLGIVGILILIYKDILESLGILLAHFRMVSKEHVCIHQHIVKIHSVCALATYYIHTVDFG